MLLTAVNSGGIIGLLTMWVALFMTGKLVPGAELTECRRRADRYLRQLLACKLGRGEIIDDDDDARDTYDGSAS